MQSSTRWLSASRRAARCVLTLAAVFAATSLASLAHAQASPPDLSPQQEALVADLSHSLVAPCCWTSSVAEHGSGQGPVLMAEIRLMVAQGMTREAILQHYVDKFGERILVEPRREGFNVLAYWIPWVAVAFGALGIVWFVKRRHPGETLEGVTLPASGSDPYQRRVREELSRLDD